MITGWRDQVGTGRRNSREAWHPVFALLLSPPTPPQANPLGFTPGTSFSFLSTTAGKIIKTEPKSHRYLCEDGPARLRRRPAKSLVFDLGGSNPPPRAIVSSSRRRDGTIMRIGTRGFGGDFSLEKGKVPGKVGRAELKGKGYSPFSSLMMRSATSILMAFSLIILTTTSFRMSGVAPAVTARFLA